MLTVRIASIVCFSTAALVALVSIWQSRGEVVGLTLHHRNVPRTRPWQPDVCTTPCPSTPPLRIWKPWLNMMTRHDLQVLWPSNGNGTKEVLIDEEVRVTIQTLETVSLKGAPFVFAWIHSEDGDVLSAEAAVPKVLGLQISAWTVAFRLADPGAYAVHFLAVTAPPYGSPPDPRAYRIERLKGSPYMLQASQLGVDGSKLASFNVSHLPKRRCQLGLDELRGRWIRSTLVSEPSRCLSLGCPRDGWTYVSGTCFWNVYSQADIQQLADVVDSGGKHLSLVAAGSSVLRGSLQSLLDALVPNAWETFAGVPSIPGQGTTVKCWGWLEYEMDNLHLAFQDWRLPSYERSDRALAAQRIQKTLREDHDVLVIELGFNVHSDERGLDHELSSFWSPIFQATLPTLRGKVFLFLGLYSPFNFEVCTAKQCAISRARAEWAKRSVKKLLASWPREIREASEGKLLVVDPAPMGLPLFFDGETQMGSRMPASQHWHRYESSQKPGRKVFGAAADVVGQLFISELLRDRKFEERLPRTEVQTTRACAQCPEKSCCPWRPVPLELNYTLEKVQVLTQFTTWAQLPLDGCGRMDRKACLPARSWGVGF